MARFPVLETIEQSVAINGFTDGGLASGHILLADALPAISFVLGWDIEITTRFSSTSGACQLSVGTFSVRDAFSANGPHPVTNGAANDIVDVPRAAYAGGNIERRVAVTVTDPLDFGNVTGGAFTVRVHYMKIEP